MSVGDRNPTTVRPAWVRVAVWVIGAVALVYLVRVAMGVDPVEFRRLWTEVDASMGVMALAVGVLHVCAASWMIRLLVPPSERSGIFAIVLMSQVAKYAPGKIWGVVMQKALAPPTLSLARLASANVIAMLLVVAAQVAVFLAALAWRSSGFPLAVLALLASAVAIFTTLLFFARFLGEGRRIVVLPEAGPRWCGALAIAWLATAVTLAAAWIALFAGAFGLSPSLVAEGVMLSTASFIAGLASLVPAGLGVREAAFVWLGSLVSGAASAAVLTLALATRVYLVALDLLSASMGFLLRIVERRR